MGAFECTAAIFFVLVAIVAWLRVAMRSMRSLMDRGRRRAGSVRSHNPTSHQATDGEWLGAIEKLTGSRAYLFDHAMRVVASGSSAGCRRRDVHVLDIFPGDAAKAVLENLVEARRTGRHSARSKWNGLDVDMCMVRHADEVVVCITHRHMDGEGRC